MSEIIDPWPPGISSLINEEDKSELNFFFWVVEQILEVDFSV